MNRKLWLAVIALAVSGCAVAGPSPSPTPVDYPCDGSRWTQAQSIIAGSADGIEATIDPTETALLPCQQFGELTGWSSVFVDMAEYDRHGREGGSLVQLGIMKRSDKPVNFAYTADNSGGIPIELSSPRPLPGVAYTLAIRRSPVGFWRLTISDGRDTKWALIEPAHWTPSSAWVMAETYDRSRFGGLRASALRLAYGSGFVPASFPLCSGVAVALGGSGGFVTSPSDEFICAADDALTVTSR